MYIPPLPNMATQQPSQVQIGAKANRLTAEQLNRARERNVYIRVGGQRNTPLLLSGAVKRWQEYPNDIYIPALRLAGDVNAIPQPLLNAGMDINTINNFIAGAYTSQHYQHTLAQQLHTDLGQ